MLSESPEEGGSWVVGTEKRAVWPKCGPSQVAKVVTDLAGLCLQAMLMSRCFILRALGKTEGIEIEGFLHN